MTNWFDGVFIGLGSNVGDRLAALEGAIDALASDVRIEVVAVSNVYETDAVGPEPQDAYLNAAARVRTALQPRPLLERFQQIELACGRDRRREPRWGPRTLDLDILLHGSLVVQEQDIRIPHPRMQDRAFVLVPLAEIAGPAVHPVLGLTIQCLLDRLDTLAGVREYATPRRVFTGH